MNLRFALALCFALTLPPAAQAAQPSDYAYRWPLQTAGESAAWRFELTPEIYAALSDPALGDFEVFNAQGRAVPVARVTTPPSQRTEVREQRVQLPVFALPRVQGAGDGVAMRLERDIDGRLRVLETQVTPSSSAIPSMIDYVVDASEGRNDGRVLPPIDRLDLQWLQADRDMRARFAVEASEDLENWRPLVDAAAVVSLRQGSAELQRRDITLPATTLPYLRLRQLDGDALPALRVSARRILRVPEPTAPARRWLQAVFLGGEPAEGAAGDAGVMRYRYRISAAVPAEAVHVQLGADNATANVTIQAQTDGVWNPIGRISVFRLRQNAERVENEALVLAQSLRAREWEVRSPVTLAPAPTLKVGYVPARFVFLAQGEGPYILAVGSRTARRQPLPVEEALAPLRAKLGRNWEPPVAKLGARAVGAADAYTEPKKPLPWKSWLLWGMLVAGAVLVGGFALSLLRRREEADE